MELLCWQAYTGNNFVCRWIGSSWPLFWQPLEIAVLASCYGSL
jgi:hypothetical protein